MITIEPPRSARRHRRRASITLIVVAAIAISAISVLAGSELGSDEPAAAVEGEVMAGLDALQQADAAFMDEMCEISEGTGPAMFVEANMSALALELGLEEADAWRVSGYMYLWCEANRI